MDDSENILNNIEDEKQSADSFTKNREIKEVVFKMLGELNDEQRNIVIMRFIEGFSNKEISIVVEKSEDAIRQIQSRALRKIRDKLPIL